MNIILCGLPMSGKTTIGTLLAAKLTCPFIDTDRLIEAAYTSQKGKNYSCRQIFLQEGEPFFRSLEKQQIASLTPTKKHIIAVGGGSLANPDNVKALQSLGCIVYLKAPLDIIWNRIKQGGIPAYLDPNDPEKAFYTLAETRIPTYEASAHITIDVGNLNKDEIVTRILQQRTVN